MIDPYRFGSGGAADPSFANVALLMHCDGTDAGTVFVDSSSYARTLSAGPATTSTTQSKFGGSSMRSAIAGDVVTLGSSQLTGLSFGTGDFTCEGWVYPTDAGAFLSFFRYDGTHTGRWYFSGRTTTRRLYVNFNGADFMNSPNDVITINAWNHCAWSRTSGVSKLFVDGVQVLSQTDTNDYQIGTTGMVIGGGLGSNFLQYEDELRITVGLGRYTANFTPPSAPFPNS